MKRLKGRLKLPLAQRGMATILIIVLTGMALTATALGVIYSVRSSQAKQVAVHAATHSQAGAWAAAQAFGLYLEKLDRTALEAFDPSKPIKFDINNNPVLATVSPLMSSTTPPRIHAEISYTDTAAKSTSTLEVVYKISPSGGGSTTPTPAQQSGPVNIHNDLDLSGRIDVEGNDSARLNVEGDVSLSGSINGIKSIQATGSVTIQGGNTVHEVYSNETLTLTGSSNVLVGSALGNIYIKSGGGKQGTLNSNADIIITVGSVEKANARGSITAESGGASHGTFIAGKAIDIKGKSLQNALAKGDITISGGSIIVADSKSMSTVICPKNWSDFDSIRAYQQTINCKQKGSNVLIAPDTSVSVPEVPVLREFKLTRPVVNAYALEQAANYRFSWLDGKTLVKVKNIENIKDGDYRLGKIKVNYNDSFGYLCSDLDSNNFCKTECTPIVNGSCQGPGTGKLRKICQGYSNNNECIEYEEKSQSWKLAGKDGVVAPGVLWFEGNLELKNGLFRNSILATGSIETGGSVTVEAVNYSGYQYTCQNTSFPSIAPINLCSSNVLTSNSIGNVALLAGSKVDDQFFGGVITLKGSTSISGSVIAGDTLLTTGNSTVRGYITAAGQGTGDTNPWKGRTTIDLRELPSNFDPSDTPLNGQGSGKAGTTVTLHWSRYL